MKELSDIFRRLGLNMIDGGLVSLTKVELTPDLLEARIYLSIFQVKDNAAAMKTIGDKGWEIKRELAARVKHQLRRIPVLQYFHDDTLEHADRMEALFRKIHEDEGEGERGEGEGERGEGAKERRGEGAKERRGEEGKTGQGPEGGEE